MCIGTVEGLSRAEIEYNGGGISKSGVASRQNKQWEHELYCKNQAAPVALTCTHQSHHLILN